MLTLWAGSSPSSNFPKAKMHHSDYLEKRVNLSADHSLNEGESRVVKLAQTSRGLEVDDRVQHGMHKVKTAAAEEALAECHNVKAVAGRVYALVIGLGSSEYWGVNNNGDAFPENALLGLPPADVAMSFYDKYAARIRQGWGYKTFLKGHVFEEHRNTNPKLAIGGIQNTFWNNRMHRVENLIWIDRTKGAKWANRLDNGTTIGTSMACFAAGTMVTMADGRRKPIENVEVDEFVITASGIARRVKETHSRIADTEILQVDTPANAAVTVTAEHPWLVLSRAEAVTGPRFKRPEDIDLSRAQWVETQHLQVGDFLLSPALAADATPDYADRALARLLGYYASEGHVLRNKHKEITGIELTVHQDDAVHDEITDLCRAYGTRNTPKTTDRANCAIARSIVIFDQRLAQACYRLVGSYAKEKYLSEEFMGWDPLLQLEFLGAYVNGDGHQNGAKWQPGSVSISTANLQLATQLVELFKRNGILSNINHIFHGGDSTFKPGSIEHQLYVGKQFANRLVGYSQKVQAFETTGKGGGQRKMNGTTILTPITGVEPADIEGLVYNLELDAEGDEQSYMVEGLVVHNCRVPADRCSVCGNLAPTRNQYCVHIKPGTSAYSLRQIKEDGTPVAMINDFPHFFDESCVENPAAPEALSIMKVARDETIATVKQAGPKAAKMEKQGPDLPLDVVLDEFQTLYQHEPLLPKPVLDKLAQFSMKEVVTGMAKLGMCLRPSELYYVAFGADALSPKMAFELDQAVVYVAPVDGWRDTIASNMQVKLANSSFGNVERVANLVKPFAEKRSYTEPYLTPRRMRAPLVKAANLRVNLDSSLAPYLAIYHGIHKKASGEYGYGATQLKNAYDVAHGGY